MKQFVLISVVVLLNLDALAQAINAQQDSLYKVLRASERDTNRVRTLLCLGSSYVFKPGEVARDLDSAILLSQQAYALSRLLGDKKGEGLSYLTAAQASREKGNRSLGEHYAQRAIGLLNSYGSAEDQAEAYMERATYYELWQAQDLAKKIGLYEKAIPLLQQTSNKLKLAGALKYRGDLYQIQEKYPRSLQDLHQALGLYRSIGYTDLKDLYDLIGFVYALQSNYVEAMRYGLLAIKLAEQQADNGHYMSTTYLRLGLTYIHLNQFKQAGFYFNKALAVAQQHKDQQALVVIKFNLFDLHYNQYKTGNALHILQDIERSYSQLDTLDQIFLNTSFIRCYNDLNLPAKATTYGQRLLTFEKRLIKKKEIYTFENIYHGLAYYFLLKHQYERARHYLLLTEPVYKKHHNLRSLSNVYYLLFKADSAQADYAKALKDYQRYKSVEATFLNATSSQQLQLLEVQYQTQKKEQNIRLLQQKSQLQQADLLTAQTTRNFSIVGGVMLILLLGLGYNRYRLKQRSNQLLEAKQLQINQTNQSLKVVIREKDNLLTEKDHLLAEKEGLLTEKEWLLKEIHHRVKNNLQIITSLLHSQGAYLKDQTAVSAIRESQNRVHAMALIHQKLYQSDRLATIPLTNYVSEIVEYLIQSFDRQDTVTTQINISPLDLDVTQAVPLGLIINEAVTNSLKYAFPDNRQGIIRIELLKLDNQAFQLTLSDDGVGLPADLNPNRSRTLGMSLIRGLSKQIGGKPEIIQERGVQIQLTFAVERIGQPELVKTEAS